MFTKISALLTCFCYSSVNTDVPEDIRRTFFDYVLLVTDLTDSEHNINQMSKMLSQICGNGTKLLIGTYLIKF